MKLLGTVVIVSMFALSGCAHSKKSCDAKKSCKMEKCGDKKSCDLKKKDAKKSCCS